MAGLVNRKGEVVAIRGLTDPPRSATIHHRTAMKAYRQAPSANADYQMPAYK